MKIRLLTLILFIAQIANGQTYARIDESFADFKDTMNVHSFDNPIAIKGQIMMGGVFVAKTNKNLITIENFSNDGFTSEYVAITIDKNLKVKSVMYDETTDNIDGSTSKYYIENLLLTFNYNPYLKGIKGLQGRYSFVIKTVWKPGKILSSEGVKAETTYQTFNGRFKNGL